MPAGAASAGPGAETSPPFPGSGLKGGYSPSDLRSAYALAATATGSGQTVAVVAAHDDPNAQSDMSTYRAEYGLPPCTAAEECFRKIDQNGGTSYPTPDTQWSEEISLDLDMVSAICPNCRILLVEANVADESNLATAEDTAVAGKASAIDDSFVGGEARGLASHYHHPGIPIAAAGGDTGYDPHASPPAPAAYPGVIAVGGTSLQPAGGRRGWSETVWSTGAGTGTGSGCSAELKPVWQTDTVCVHRTTNDISAVADPNTPVSVYDSYKTGEPWLLLGGTSAAAPIVAATMAMATPYTRSFDGAEALYLDAGSGSGGFNDVVAGSNGSCGTYLCRATVGYDGPSGLGTLSGVPNLPTPAPATGTASSIEATEATLRATVDTHGADVAACKFQYGATMAYEASVPCSSPPGRNYGPTQVSARLSGLSASSEYHFRILVEYATGSAAGLDAVFATSGRPPSVSTLAATAVTSSAATLNGSVNPNGPAVLQCSFEYGPTAAYGASLPCSATPGSGTSSVVVFATLGGLGPGAVYHYRLRASTLNGSTDGADRTVTALPLTPTVSTGSATAVTATSATLTGTVDSRGAPLSSCAFEFNSADSLLPCAVLPTAGSGPAAVTANVSGLRPGTVFSYRLLATNAGGTGYAAISQFATLLAGPLEPVLPGQPAGPAKPYHAVLTRRSITVGPAGSAPLRIRCPAQLRRCTGRVIIRATTRSRGGGSTSTRMVTLASARFHAGRTGVATVAPVLSSRARSALARKGVLRAIATLVTNAPAGPPGTWRTVVVLRAGSAGARRAT